MESREQFIRVIVAVSQTIFRAWLRKVFAAEDELRVVGHAETLPQAISAAKKFPAEILIFEAALAARPLEAVQEIMRTAPGLRLLVVTEAPEQELTLALFARGAHAIVSRQTDARLFVECVRTLRRGQPWLEPHAVKWVLEAFRTQNIRPHRVGTRAELTPKEALIVSCVTQGMKNKEIAVRIGTTEQVVKNYLRKIYDKLGVGDRLELALYCLNNRAALDSSSRTEPAALPASGETLSGNQIESANTGKTAPPRTLDTPHG